MNVRDIPYTLVLRFSKTELEIFRLMGEGLTTEEISEAKQYRVTVKTIESHVARMKTKTGVGLMKLRTFAARYVMWEEQEQIKLQPLARKDVIHHTLVAPSN